VGFKYLDGKRWDQVTRDERFFCQRLYEIIIMEKPEQFVAYLRDAHGLDVPGEGEWEAGFEVCFYRDLWQHRERKGPLFSPKRTFDLCLFGEKAIIIIEAKAAGGFDEDQMESFAGDIIEVAKLTKVDNVKLVGLCSSQYEVEPEFKSTFDGKILTWKALADRYDNDDILLRADDVYKRQRPFLGSSRYSNVKLNGADLLNAFRGGAKWWVGRGGGGIRGDRFKEDLRNGRWREQQYEVNTRADWPPSINYFSLEQFAEAVGAINSGMEDS
jgi:hypothetical protein